MGVQPRRAASLNLGGGGRFLFCLSGRGEAVEPVHVAVGQVVVVVEETSCGGGDIIGGPTTNPRIVLQQWQDEGFPKPAGCP